MKTSRPPIYIEADSLATLNHYVFWMYKLWFDIVWEWEPKRNLKFILCVNCQPSKEAMEKSKKYWVEIININK